jgi:hypothetical protein
MTGIHATPKVSIKRNRQPDQVVSQLRSFSQLEWYLECCEEIQAEPLLLQTPPKEFLDTLTPSTSGSSSKSSTSLPLQPHAHAINATVVNPSAASAPVKKVVAGSGTGTKAKRGLKRL